MTARRRATLLLLLVMSTRGYAGHGFMNSFADVVWLPEPGYTPDSLLYALDNLLEAFELKLAAFRGNEFSLSLEFAREKLAETSAMIKRHRGDLAADAAARYQGYIERAASCIARAPEAGRGELRQTYMNAVLEQVYIMSVDYVDMPLEVRPVVMNPLFDDAMALFGAQREALSEPGRKAFFFKEEEIRWSLEMVRQADAQKITNE